MTAAKLEMVVSGERACFRRPEFKRDLITYDVITPAVAKMILDRLYSPAGLKWRLARIDILNPIRREWSGQVAIEPPRRMLVLRDVAYLLSASLVDSDGKDQSEFHTVEFRRRIANAAEGRPLHLGLRDFLAEVSLPSPADRPHLGSELDLGWLPFETGQGLGALAPFCRVVAIDGSIDLSRIEEAQLPV